jgi:hypothetical protein
VKKGKVKNVSHVVFVRVELFKVYFGIPILADISVLCFHAALMFKDW